MHLSDRASAVLNFKTNMRAWRELVAQRAVDADCARAKCEYHEVHLYCRADTVSDRQHLLHLSKRFNLWAGRFRFTHEYRNGELALIDDDSAREEVMLGTHFHMPSQLVDVMAAELLGVAKQVGADVERIRVEKPLGRSPVRISGKSDKGWWEAHLPIPHDKDFSGLSRESGIRDVSQKIDFISGEGLSHGYVNIEAQGQAAAQFAAKCISVTRSVIRRTGRNVLASLEEVLIDVPTAVLN